MTILVVEDSKEILTNILDYLGLQGHELDCAEDGLTALHLLSTQFYDLVILDVMLPGVDGYKICQKMRQELKLNTPVIMLTARDTLDDRLEGFRMGVDDYVVKPFALSELAARIDALLRRSQAKSQDILQVEDLKFDRSLIEVSRNGQSIKLSRASLKLLETLMLHSPGVVRRTDLEQALWGGEPPDSDSLRSHIHQLRQAIDKPFPKPLLHTIHGVGYCLKG